MTGPHPLTRDAKGDEAHTAQYEIRFSKARQRRGLPGYAVFLVEAQGTAEEWLRGVSSHHTEEEAEAAMAKLEASQQ